MEVGSRKLPCSIRRPGHPPPPPPPLKLGLRKEQEGGSSHEDSKMSPQPAPPRRNAPLRRAPPPPLPRAPQISQINSGFPVQPQNRPLNCQQPSPPHVRNTLSATRSISVMPTKTAAPVSIVRPYNFPPLPTTSGFDSSEESKSPEEGSFFKDPAQCKIRSSSPSFLDELQQVFPLLRQEEALPSNSYCASPCQPKCNEDDQSEPDSKCETSNDQDCLPSIAKAASIADLSKETSLPINVKGQSPFKPVPITLQRRASVPVMPHTNQPRKPTTLDKPVLSHPLLLSNSRFTNDTTAAVDSTKHIFIGKDQALRPVLKSSSLRELTIRRNEVGYATLPRPPAHPAPAPPAHCQRPSLPPRLQSFLLPAAPPPPPKRRESLVLQKECQETGTSSFETRFLSRFHPAEDLPPPELPSPL